MPITANTDGQDFNPTDFIHNDELTLEAEVMSDFLACADFSAIFEHPEAEAHIQTITQEDEEGNTEPIDVIPGDVALQLIDEDDMLEMFVEYVDSLPSETLEDVARKTAIAQLLDEKFKKGTFKKVHKVKGGPALVNKMIGAMMSKKAIKRDGKKYAKGAAYGGGTGAEKKIIAKKYKKAKAKFGKKRASQKVYKTLKKLTASDQNDVANLSEMSIVGDAYGIEVGGEAYALTLSVNTLAESITESIYVPHTSVDETTLTTPLRLGASLAGSVSKLMEREL
jgi:hypothetical protein